MKINLEVSETSIMYRVHENNNNRSSTPNYQDIDSPSNLSETNTNGCSSSDSSPILDFKERKLAFEKTMNNSNVSTVPRSRVSKKHPALIASAHSNGTLSRSTMKTSPKLVPRKISPDIPLKPSFLTSKPIHSPVLVDSVNEPVFDFDSQLTPSNSSHSSENSSPRTPRETTTLPRPFKRVPRAALSDGDSDKSADADDHLDYRAHLHANQDSNQNRSGFGRYSNKLSSSDDSLDGRLKDCRADEKIPVFCVQDYERGRLKKDQRTNPSRSRSVGAELKAQQEQVTQEMDQPDDNSYAARRWKMSSDGLNNGKIIKPNSSGFKDKQKMIEALIKKGNVPDGDTDSKLSHNSKKASNVFRKISFTSKLDKDLQNKIAKGDLDMKGINLLKHYDHNNKPKVDAIVPNGNTSKRKMSKILPKLTPLVPALRLPHGALSDKLKRNESSSQSSERNCADVPTRRKSDESTNCEMGKELIKELKQTNLLDKKALVPPPKRKTLPEMDLIKLKSKAELNKEAHSVDIDKELVDVKFKPVILPKKQQTVIKKGPIKPSQIYSIRHTDQTDSSTDSSSSPKPDEDQAPAFPPVRPPRRRNSGSPKKKNKAPLPPTDPEACTAGSNGTGQPIYSEPSIYSEPTVEVSRSSEEISQVDSSSPASTSPSPSSDNGTVREAETYLNVELPKPLSKAGLPNGPPPQKPPRTFAYEIYNNSKVRRMSKSSSESLPQISPDSPEKNQSSNGSIPPAPIYAIVNKKKDSQSRACPPADVPKPTIAPKPAHIKSLASNKRLSLVESTTTTELNSENNADEEEDIHKQAHMRFSLRRAGREPPGRSPPEPPSNPKPVSAVQSHVSPESAGNMDSANPSSLQCWQSDHFALVKEGSLSRQKSMSDETLASSSGYQRVRGTANEPIYATPDLRSAGRRTRAGSGGELHYMCSDLFSSGSSSSSVLSPSGASGGASDSRKLGSRSNIIAAWKQEFRQSCRQVQHRLKKTVNR